MAFSDELLDAGSDIWAAQFAHPFVSELAAGDLDDAAFNRWLEQDYRYLFDYGSARRKPRGLARGGCQARTYAIAGAKAREESTMATLLGGADRRVERET